MAIRPSPSRQTFSEKLKLMLDKYHPFWSYTPCSRGSGSKRSGGIAQLGERCNGIAEVSGSIPLTSTIEAQEGT